MTHDSLALRRLAWLGLATLPVLSIVQGLLMRFAPDLSVETAAVPLWPALALIALYYGDIAWRRVPRHAIAAAVAVAGLTSVTAWWGGWEAGVVSFLGLAALAGAALAWAEARAALLFGRSGVATAGLALAAAAVPVAAATIALLVWVLLRRDFEGPPRGIAIGLWSAAAFSALLIIALSVIDHRGWRTARRMIAAAGMQSA